MRLITPLVLLALLAGCASAPKPEAPAAVNASPVAEQKADAFAGCEATQVRQNGFSLECGKRLLSLDFVSLPPEAAAEALLRVINSSLTGDVRIQAVDRDVAGVRRQGLRFAAMAQRTKDAYLVGEILSWSEPDGRTRVVSCGASAGEWSACEGALAALSIAKGLPEGIAAPPQANAVWRPDGWSMPEGCREHPQSGPRAARFVCADGELGLWKMGEAGPTGIEETFDRLLEQYRLMLRDVAGRLEVKRAQCAFGEQQVPCATMVLPAGIQQHETILTAVGDLGESRVSFACTYDAEAGMPAFCKRWVTLAE